MFPTYDSWLARSIYSSSSTPSSTMAIRHSSGCETLISISLFIADVAFLYARVEPRRQGPASVSRGPRSRGGRLGAHRSAELPSQAGQAAHRAAGERSDSQAGGGRQ